MIDPRCKHEVDGEFGCADYEPINLEEKPAISQPVCKNDLNKTESGREDD